MGASGSVFLAGKDSGRKVALKVMPMDTSDEEDYERFLRELESVVELNSHADREIIEISVLFILKIGLLAAISCVLLCNIVMGGRWRRRLSGNPSAHLWCHTQRGVLLGMHCR